MGILSSMEQRATSQTIGPPRDPVIAAWFGTNNSAAGMVVTPESSMRVTAVYRAVSILAQTYASLPLGVFRLQDNGGKERDRKHPLYDVLCRRPNRWQTSFEWREMMSGHFALRGRAYSEIVSTGGKAVAELVPLHPDRVRPFWAPDGKIAFQYTPRNGNKRIILGSEMHYLHGLTLDDDGITPLSPISAAGREAIGVAMAAQEHNSRLFANGTRLSGILKMPGHLKDDIKRKEFLKSWKEAYGGARNVGKTALLEDNMDWQSIGLSSIDAQLIETLRWGVSDISRIFDGIPLHMLSELDRSTNNNIEYQGMSLVTHTIRPGAIRREEAMERDLLYGTSLQTHCISFDLDGLMRGDMAARSAYNASGLQNGYLNPNEVRISEGKNPSDAPGMDDFHIQSNMTLMQLLEKLTQSNPPPKQTDQGAAP